MTCHVLKMAGKNVFFVECSDVQMLQSELNSRLAHKVRILSMHVCIDPLNVCARAPSFSKHVTKHASWIVTSRLLVCTQLHQRQDVASTEEHAALRREFEVEREQHAMTQSQVALLSEKLLLAEGEVRMLSKQLEREKETFDNA